MKISGPAILTIGVCVALIAVGFAYFFHWAPNTTEAGYAQEYEALLDAEIAKEPQAQARVDDARAKVMELSDQWQAVVAQKTPPAELSKGGISLGVNPYQLTVDSPKFRDAMQRKVNQQLKTGGVTVVQGPRIPDPTTDSNSILASYYNYPAATFPVCVFNLGTVTIRGNYDQISRNIRSWANVQGYMAVADNPVISGTSPRLTATYALTIVAYVRGQELPPVLASAAPAAAGAGAGAPFAGGGRPSDLETGDQGAEER